MALLLELEGLQVRTALNAKAALEVVDLFEPHVAVIDIGLPDIDGLSLCQLMRERVPGCRMVAFSGFAQEQDFQNSEAAGFDAHLPKPANPVRAILKLLEDRG